MINKVLFSSKYMCWCTPQSVFDALDAEFHFTLDAAATAKSAKCARYYTPAENALAQEWHELARGGSVFLNPPYGRELEKWVRKAYEQHIKHGLTVVLLIPARTDTKYFQNFIFYGKAAEVRFVRGRLKFTDEDGNQTQAAPFPSAIVIYK